MPKIKTHKGCSKVFKTNKNNVTKIGKPSSRHNTGKKTAKFNRKNRKGSNLSRGDQKRLKNLV